MLSKLAATLALCAVACAQTVIIAGNAASGAAGVPASSVAPGSIVAVEMLRRGPVPLNPDLSKIVVTIGQAQAPVLAASLGTVLARVPEDTPPGPADVVLRMDGEPSLPAQIRIVPVAPGIFPALAQNARPGQLLSLNRLTGPALAGEYIVLWGTGLGAAQQDEVTVEVGGTPVKPDYAGPAPGFPGLDQINVRVPAGAPDGCYVSVILKARDAVSNEVTVAKAAQPGPCEHPFGLRPQDLSALDEGRSVRVALISLRSEVMPPPGPPYTTYTRNEAAFGELTLRTASDVALMAQALASGDAWYGCRLFNQAATPRFTQVDQFDAGDRFAVTGPGGKSMEVPRTLPVVYLHVLPAPDAVALPKDLPPPFFVPGIWKAAFPGGATVAPVEAALTLPPPLRWTNRELFAASIDRSSDQAVTWEPDGYSESDVMTVTLSTPSFSGQDFAASGLICRAPAAAGRLVLPGELLRGIPPSPLMAPFPMASLELRLAPKPWARKQFDLPLTAGGTERALVDYLFAETLRTSLR